MVAPPFVRANLIPDCLLQWHEIQTAAFHRLDGMCQSAAPVTLNVECTDSGPGWAWGTAAWRQLFRRVHETVTLGGRPGEGDWYHFRGEKGEKNKKKPCTRHCRIYSRSFWITPLSINGRGQAQSAVSSVAEH